MEMKSFNLLSEAESEIMEFLWQQEDEVILQDVIGYCNDEKGHTWKQQTIFTFLTRLEQKGVVKAQKRGQKRYYSALITEEELKRRYSHKFVDEHFEGSVIMFLSNFFSGQELPPEDKAALKEFIEK